MSRLPIVSALLDRIMILRPVQLTDADRRVMAVGYNSFFVFIVLLCVGHWHLLDEPYAGYADGAAVASSIVYLTCFILMGARQAAEGSGVNGFGAQILHVAKKVSLYMFLPVAILTALFLGLLYVLHRFP